MARCWTSEAQLQLTQVWRKKQALFRILKKEKKMDNSPKRKDGWIEIFTWTIRKNGKTYRAKDKPYHFWLKPKK
jgi:hypothetical protein